MAKAKESSNKTGGRRRTSTSKVTSSGASTNTRYNSKKQKTRKLYRGQGR